MSKEFSCGDIEAEVTESGYVIVREKDADDGVTMSPSEAQSFSTWLREIVDNYDGAPYCSDCGAISRRYCTCVPREVV